jgi:hypothetical protein
MPRQRLRLAPELLLRESVAAQNHLILGRAIRKNWYRKIKHLRRAQEQGFWASVSGQAAGVQSGTDVNAQPVHFRYRTKDRGPLSRDSGQVPSPLRRNQRIVSECRHPIRT